MSTKIEWCEETWNPIIGCSHVSPGCDNCYAERMAGRLANMQSLTNYGQVVKWKESEKYSDYPIGTWNGRTHLVESALEKPFHWKKPRTIFVCSMGDLFHESVPFEWIQEVWDVMASNPQHTFLVLTKRPERILPFFRYMGSRCKDAGFDSVPSQSDDMLNYLYPIDNVWLGVTAENQQQADKRIPILLQIPAAKRFVSVEPMLGPVDLDTITIPIERLDWVIVGGETGTGARPMHPDWVRSIRDQCVSAGVPFFFKQWGEYLLFEEFDIAMDGMFCKVGKKKAGHLLEGKIYNQKP